MLAGSHLVSLWVEGSAFFDLLQNEQESSTPLVQWKSRRQSPWAGTKTRSSTTPNLSRFWAVTTSSSSSIWACASSNSALPTADCRNDVRVHHLDIFVCQVVVTKVVAVEDAYFLARLRRGRPLPCARHRLDPARLAQCSLRTAGGLPVVSGRASHEPSCPATCSARA